MKHGLRGLRVLDFSSDIPGAYATKLLADAGALFASLGPRVLRTETAALAAIAVLQSHRGDFA